MAFLSNILLTIYSLFYLLYTGFRFLTTRTVDQQNAVIQHFFSYTVIDLWKLKVEIEGIENVDPSKQYIVISNHQSLMDIPILFYVLPLNIRMAAKAELFQIPLFGIFLKHGRFIPIYRKNSDAAIRELRRSVELFDEGISIFMAPEGTRSKTGQLLPFKKGAFVMGIQNQKDILPVVLIGTQNVIPHGSIIINRYTPVKAKILPPISVDGLGYEDRSRITKEAYSAMQTALSEG